MAIDTVTTKIAIVVQDEPFAFDALKVRNILEISKMTRVPNAKDFILGVINHHGTIIPVADFAIILGKRPIKIHKECAIIVVSNDDSLESQIGFLVEEVREVFELKQEAITKSVAHDGAGLVDNFEGTVNKDGEFIQLINIEQLISVLES